jgi:hypothetical protein
MSIFLASAALWFGVAFFLPLTILFGNPAELKSSRTHAVSFMGAIAGLLSMMWYGASMLLPAGLTAGAGAVTLGLALLTLIQGQVLIRNYGAFDGKEIDWPKFAVYTKIDFLLWTIVLLLAAGIAILFEAMIVSYGSYVATAILFLHGLNLLGHRGGTKARSHKLYYPNDRTMFDFSAERNIVVMVIDALRGDVVQRLLSQNEELRQQLQGFTFFNNASGSFPTTNLSLPLILTGKEYDNSRPYSEYLKKAFLSDTSLPYVLRKDNFVTDGHTACFQTIYCTPEVFSNFLPIGSIGALNLRELAHLLELALFRASPNFFKPFIYRNEHWLFSSRFNQVIGSGGSDQSAYYMPWPKTEKYFLPKAETEISARSSKPTFKFYHLFGAHPPYWIGPDGIEATGAVPETQEAYDTQALACLKYFAEFITQLKRANVYDQTMIVMTGDHGAFAGDFPDGDDISTGQLMKIANPALMIKAFQADAPLKIDGRAARLADIAGTVLHALKPDSAHVSLLAPAAAPVAERPFYYFSQSVTWDTDEWAVPLRKYVIDGDVHDPSSWRDSGIVLYPALNAGELHKLNTAVAAEQLWDTPGLSVLGFYEPEFGMSWTSTTMTLYFSLEETHGQALTLLLDVEAIQPARHGLRFRVDGGVESAVALHGRQVLTLPLESQRGGVMALHIELDQPWPEPRPDGFLLLDVTRVLGLRFRRLALCDRATADSIETDWQSEVTAALTHRGPRLLEPGKGGIDLLAGGWTVPANGYSWSARKQVALQMQVQSGQGVILALQLIPLIHPGILEFQRVIARIGERVLTELMVREAGVYHIAVPAELCVDGALRLTLELPNAHSLSSLGVSDDLTLLAVQLTAVTLNPIPLLTPEYSQLFQEGAAAEDWLLSGWKAPEPHSTWATGQNTRLRFSLEQGGQCIRVNMHLSPLLYGEQLPQQRVIVQSHGQTLAHWDVAAVGWYSVVVPPRLTATGIVELALELPDASSLASLGLDSNETPLAVQLSEMNMSLLPLFPLGEDQPFNESVAGLASWLGQGWSQPGPQFVWSSHGSASLHLVVGCEHDWLVLRLHCVPLIVAGALEAQRIGVTVNGKPLAQFLVSHADICSVFLSAEVIGNGILDVRLEFPDATSLAALGLGEGKTPLAIQLSAVTVAPHDPLVAKVQYVANHGSGIERWLGEGWKKPEQHFTWSAARFAVIRLPIENSGRAMMLRARLHPLSVPGMQPFQRVNLSSGPQELGQWVVEHGAWFEIYVPAGAIRYGVLELRLSLPDAMSLEQLGLGTAAVFLGVQLHELEVLMVAPCAKYQMGERSTVHRQRLRSSRLSQARLQGA